MWVDHAGHLAARPSHPRGTWKKSLRLRNLPPHPLRDMCTCARVLKATRTAHPLRQTYQIFGIFHPCFWVSTLWVLRNAFKKMLPIQKSSPISRLSAQLTTLSTLKPNLSRPQVSQTMQTACERLREENKSKDEEESQRNYIFRLLADLANAEFYKRWSSVAFYPINFHPRCRFRRAQRLQRHRFQRMHRPAVSTKATHWTNQVTPILSQLQSCNFSQCFRRGGLRTVRTHPNQQCMQPATCETFGILLAEQACRVLQNVAKH